jgi:hypothetical protein
MDYGVDPVSEMMKIKYYQDGISDPFFNLVRLSIQTNPHLFTTFNQVKDHYTIFKRMTSAQDNPRTVHRGISSVGRGGPGRGRGGRGGGNNYDARKPTQEQIDACTHIQARRYESKEYSAFTPAEKAKHWQLMNPTRTPRGPAKCGGRRGGGRNGGQGYAYLSEDTPRKTPSSTASETSTKRTKYKDRTDHGSDLFPPTNDESTTSNQKNKALTRSTPHGRQTHGKSDE